MFYEQEMNKLFVLDASETYTNKADFIQKLQARIGEKNTNKEFLMQEIQLFADEMEAGGIFQRLVSESIETQQRVWAYLKNTYIA